jgi:DNA-binding FadR family transcriptional regulator
VTERVAEPTAFGLTTAGVRTLLAGPEESGAGRGEMIARRLGDAIRLGLLQDGERLPPEDELAKQLGVSKVTLREALTALRGQGLVSTRRGRGGGSFVHAPADRAEPLRGFSVTELRDLGDQRCAIAGAAARLAAERADPDELERLGEQLERLRTAETVSERRRASTELTLAVAAAAQSARLTHEEARLRSELGDLLHFELDAGDYEALVRDRERLVAAIADGDAALAAAVAEQHVLWETERLIALRMLAADMRAEPGDEPLGAVVEALAEVFRALEALGGELGELIDARGPLRREDLEALRPTILALLGGIVTGAGIVAAPGLLSDAPRWLEWWWTGARGVPEALRVNLDPAAPDFYDYTRADWYTTREPRISGPYVDYACTNEYALTLAVPLTGRGVAAADVLVSTLERTVVPALAALGRPVALTNAHGRVIASSSASVRPGTRLAVEGSRPASTATPARAWRLVDL